MLAHHHHHRMELRRPGLRLFCFPYAGGGPSIFRAFQAELGNRIEVVPVVPPGRASRGSEKPVVSIEEMAELYALEMMPHLDRPFALLGYSMGALVAFETARKLRSRGAFPDRLIACALAAPHIERRARRIHELPEAEFAAEIRRLNGTPEAVLQDSELMRLALPALRADFRALETYRYRVEAPLECPISAIGGAQDRAVSRNALVAWREHTSNGFDERILPGDHFFLHTRCSLLTYAIRQDLAEPRRLAC